MNRLINRPSQNSGFTLVEMLVALVVSTILMALIMGSYWAQTRSSRDKQMIVGMQQNMRSAMFFMARDIRMAGYDTNFQDLPSDTSIVTALPNVFSFQYEDDETGNVVTVSYSLVDDPGDSDGNLDLEKQVDADPPLYLARNIESLEFFYTLQDGQQSTDPVTTLGAAPEDIRAVGVSILARGERISMVREPNISFTTLSGTVWGPFNDGIRRQILTTTVKCRNMFRTT